MFDFMNTGSCPLQSHKYPTEDTWAGQSLAASLLRGAGSPLVAPRPPRNSVDCSGSRGQHLTHRLFLSMQGMGWTCQGASGELHLPED